jgi:hypothetical protein
MQSKWTAKIYCHYIGYITYTASKLKAETGQEAVVSYFKVWIERLEKLPAIKGLVDQGG